MQELSINHWAHDGAFCAEPLAPPRSEIQKRFIGHPTAGRRRCETGVPTRALERLACLAKDYNENPRLRKFTGNTLATTLGTSAVRFLFILAQNSKIISKMNLSQSELEHCCKDQTVRRRASVFVLLLLIVKSTTRILF